MKVEGGGHYLRAVNDGAGTVIVFKEVVTFSFHTKFCPHKKNPYVESVNLQK